MSKIILISGLVGAGKSTYARKLATEINAIRFSVDEWMTRLFGDDFPDDLNFEWSMERIYRIEAQMWSLVHQTQSLNIPIILDLGLMQREHRQKFYNWAKDNNYQIETHVIEAEKSVREERVLKRNKEKGETYSLEVTEEMFDFCENLYEYPDQEELAYCTFIRTDK